MESYKMNNSTTPRLRTNVIDYRPLTASQVSLSSTPKPEGGGAGTHQAYQSRSISPVSIMRLSSSSSSARVPKEQIYRTILEKNEFDMDKLVQNLPESILMTPGRYNTNVGSGSRHVNGIFSKALSTASTGAGGVSTKDGRKVKCHGTASVPCSSRRDKDSFRKDSKRTLESKRPTTVVVEEKDDVEDQRLRYSPSKKDVLLKHVFAVNGSVVAFKSCGYENFTNWFGDENMLRKEKKPSAVDYFHRELDVWEFTNQELSMKLYCGNKLQIEGHRPAKGKTPAKRFKETIILPSDLPVEALIMCRTRSGRLIIQEIPRVKI